MQYPTKGLRCELANISLDFTSNCYVQDAHTMRDIPRGGGGGEGEEGVATPIFHKYLSKPFY